MRHYCSFFVRSDRQDESRRIFVPAIADFLEFDDMQSPERLAQSARLRRVGLARRSDLLRYCWSIDSRKGVGTDEADPYVHIAWLLLQLNPGLSLDAERNRGVEFSLSFYWGGQGTGGGPLISLALSELLLRHQLSLDIGFYIDSGEQLV